MSGNKSSEISYDPRGEIMINLRLLKEDLLRLLKSITSRIDHSWQECESVSKSFHNEVLSRITEKTLEKIIQIREQADKTERKYNGLVFDINTGVNELRNHERQLNKEKSLIAKKIAEITHINNKLVQIVEIDELSSKTEHIISNINECLKKNSSILHKWNQEDYLQIQNKYEVLKKIANEENKKIISIKLENLSTCTLNDVNTEAQKTLHTLEKMVNEYSSKEKELRKIYNSVHNLKQEICDKLGSCADHSVKRKLSEQLDNIKTFENKLHKKNYSGVDEKINEIRSTVTGLEKADSFLIKLETGLQEINSEKELNHYILQRWESDKYKTCSASQNAIYEELRDLREKLIKHGHISLSVVQRLIDEAVLIKSQLKGALKTAIDKEQSHQKRLYVVKSLREVCASMGFEEKGDPYFETEDERTSAVIQEFKTFVYGDLIFRITLNGNLESTSGISTEHCGEQFEEISTALKDHYGIKTEFRLEDEDEPLKTKKTAKRIPDDFSLHMVESE
jgi:hypothetical protein